MNDFEAPRKEIDVQVKRLDARPQDLQSQIASIKDEKVELCRRRNAMAPIAKLPSELIIKVSSYLHLSAYEMVYLAPPPAGLPPNMTLSLTTQGTQEALYRQVSRPPGRVLSQICHFWRNVAMGSPQCWTHIQLCDSTAPGLLRFMWRNTGAQPLIVEYASTPSHLSYLPNPKTIEVLQELVEADIGRIKCMRSLRQPYRSNSRVFDFLHTLVGEATLLDTVEFKEGTGVPGAKHAFLSGGAPLLRSLTLYGTSISWQSPAFASPRLTNVALTSSPEPTPEAIVELLCFLANAPQLKSFSVILPSSSGALQDLMAVRSGFRDPILLPNLDNLRIQSSHAEPLLVILPAILTPKDSNLCILCNENPGSIVGVLAHFIVGGIGQASWVPPEELQFGPGVVLGWRKLKSRWVDTATGKLPGQRLRIVAELAQTVVQPFLIIPENTVYRLPWTATSLKAVTFEWASPHHRAPLWNILVRQAALEYLQLPIAECDDFLRQLGGAALGDGDSVGSGGTVSFPQLRCVRFQEVPAAAGLGIPDPGFFGKLLEAIQVRQKLGAPRLYELAFNHYPSSSADIDLLRLIAPLVNQIFWDDAVLF